MRYCVSLAWTGVYNLSQLGVVIASMRSLAFKIIHFFPWLWLISLYFDLCAGIIFYPNVRRERMSSSIHTILNMYICTVCVRVDRRRRRRRHSFFISFFSLNTCESVYRLHVWYLSVERAKHIGHVACRFGERYVECTVDFLTVRLFVIVRARTRDTFCMNIVCSAQSNE